MTCWQLCVDQQRPNSWPSWLSFSVPSGSDQLVRVVSAFWPRHYTFDESQVRQAAAAAGKFEPAHKLPRKALEQCLGLLIWATSVSKHLRPGLAPLYSDLHSPPGSMCSVSASTWQSFLSSLDSTGRTTRAMPGLWIPTLAKVIECSGKPVRCRADLPAVPASHKPHGLRKDSKFCLNWLSRCFASTPTVPLALPPLLPCLAAADACAEGNTVGIGGWFLTSNAFAWFGETWSMSDIRQTWPFLTKPAQRYIACFETIAQFALLQIAHATSGQGRYHFTLPSGTDNSATEADINKMFTTSWPMQVFLQLIASWAHSHNVVLQPTHIAGSANGWADDLSRNRLSRFANQSQHRRRFTPENIADAAAAQRDRAMPGRTGLSTRSAQPSAAALYLCRPSLHLPRSQHELLWHEEAGA